MMCRMSIRKRHPWRAAIAFIFLALLCPNAVRADIEFPGEPMPLADAKGKTGPLRVTLPERSPLSAPKDIIKRMHLKGVEVDDYDWAKEVYDLYVPKEPGEGGKYGLMVGAVFKDFGGPPGDWGDLLDQYHVIWICSETVGEGQPELRRVGTMLDAAHNVRKAFPIQDERVYASIGSWKGPVAGTALHYADVFEGGAMYTIGWHWFARLPAGKPKFQPWPAGDIAPPDTDRLGQAKARGRYFFVKRKEDVTEDGPDRDTDVVRQGYTGTGFKNVKLIFVTHDQMGHYGAYDPKMFEEAITFLDAPLSKLPPKIAGKTADSPPAAVEAPKAAVKDATPTPPTPPAATPPAALTSDEANDKANKALAMANNYLALKKYELARPKLEKIVKDYPDTPAAKEAKALLKALEGK